MGELMKFNLQLCNVLFAIVKKHTTTVSAFWDIYTYEKFSSSTGWIGVFPGYPNIYAKAFGQLSHLAVHLDDK